MNPQPTPVPIHDIAAPVALFPWPLWMVIAAALGVLALLALLAWALFFRRPRKRALTPKERALAGLEALRAAAAKDDPYVFSIRVSDVLRGYLHDAHGLSATTQTSMEFLATVRSRTTFSAEESAALAAFLEKADLIKFARMHATAADCDELLGLAARLVEAAPRAAGPEEAKP